MSGAAAPGPSSAGLEHIGYVYGSTVDLARDVSSRVQAVLDSGGEVSAVVDAAEAEALRSVVGSRPGITFTPPDEVVRPQSTFFGHLRDVASRGHGMVLAQYSVLGLTDGPLRRNEDAINQQLAHLPLTLICAYPITAEASRLDTARAVHPRLLVDGTINDNDAYRRAESDAGAELRTPVLGLTFRGAADLHHVRGHVRSAASRAGLDDDAVAAYVLSVHEAALAVTNDPRTESSEPCELDMWVSEETISVEIRGLRRSSAPDGDGDEDPLEYVRRFCWRAERFEVGGAHGVRVVTRRPARR